MSRSDRHTTITLTREAKASLDEYGKKYENYSELLTRLVKEIESFRSCAVTSKESKVKDEIQDEE